MKPTTLLYRFAFMAASLLSMPAFAATLPGWIGTYTYTPRQSTGSTGIYAFDWDAETGQLSSVRAAANASNPSFVVLHPNGRYLYSVNEELGTSGRLTSYVINPDSAEKLVQLNSVGSRGVEPCHLSIDPSGKWLFVANYESGNIRVYHIRPDGRIGEARQDIQQTGSGPMTRQKNAHAHQVVLSPDGRYLLSVDLGADKIFVYRFNPATGELNANNPAAFVAPAGSGPRHLVFSKDARFVYLFTEFEPTIITLGWDARQGTLTQRGSVSTLPAGFTGRKSGAEIGLHPSGKFLYASNRGDSNTIALFRIGADGLPVAAGHVPSGGTSPRFFNFDPSGKFLIAAHQASNDIFVFRIDQNSGALTREGPRIEVPAPVSFLFGSESKR